MPDQSYENVKNHFQSFVMRDLIDYNDLCLSTDMSRTHSNTDSPRVSSILRLENARCGAGSFLRYAYAFMHWRGNS